MKTHINKYMFHNLRNYIQYKILHHIHFVYDTNQLNKMNDTFQNVLSSNKSQVIT